MEVKLTLRVRDKEVEEVEKRREKKEEAECSLCAVSCTFLNAQHMKLLQRHFQRHSKGTPKGTPTTSKVTSCHVLVFKQPIVLFPFPIQ